MATKVQSKSSRSSLSKPTKITHLYLHERFLKNIPKLSEPQNLSVLYLHDNEIQEITNLHNCINLTSLYLQKNRIVKLENLDSLRKLRKLYLGQNTISVVEGLENVECLEELHVEKQFLMEGNCLCFDPRSVFRISNTLQILNISHNKIQSISILAPLRRLKILDASHNEISDLEAVCALLQNWSELKEISFVSNPLTKNRLYKENIIANSWRLETLDHKEISETTRLFLRNLNKERKAQTLSKPTLNLVDEIPDVPKNYPMSVQKAVSASILKQKELFGDSADIFDERNAVYIPWNTMPKPPSVPKLRYITKNQGKVKKGRPGTGPTSKFSNLKI